MNPTQHFKFWPTLKSAWFVTKGIKLKLWFVLLAMLVLFFIFWHFTRFYFGYRPGQLPYGVSFYLAPALSALTLTPLMTGAMMLSLEHLRGKKPSFTVGFAYFRQLIPLAVGSFFVAVISDIGWNVLHFTGTTRIGFSTVLASAITVLTLILFSLSFPLIADKKFSVIRALQASFFITRKAFGRLLALYVYIYLVLIVLFGLLYLSSMLIPKLQLIGIALFVCCAIWVLPYIFLLYATAYTKLVDAALEATKP